MLQASAEVFSFPECDIFHLQIKRNNHGPAANTIISDMFDQLIKKNIAKMENIKKNYMEKVEKAKSMPGASITPEAHQQLINFINKWFTDIIAQLQDAKNTYASRYEPNTKLPITSVCNEEIIFGLAAFAAFNFHIVNYLKFHNIASSNDSIRGKWLQAPESVARQMSNMRCYHSIMQGEFNVARLCQEVDRLYFNRGTTLPVCKERLSAPEENISLAFVFTTPSGHHIHGDVRALNEAGLTFRFEITILVKEY